MSRALAINSSLDSVGLSVVSGCCKKSIIDAGSCRSWAWRATPQSCLGRRGAGLGLAAGQHGGSDGLPRVRREHRQAFSS